ncbi:hypothetical protein MBT84_22185 [Streptomyces sp. MBT84]|nr:hypothetical protein [Streptomyces sp. MBT84]
MSLPLVTRPLSTRAPQSVIVITVIVCILWGTLPQVQELVSSLIVLNALWLAQMSMSTTDWRPLVGPWAHNSEAQQSRQSLLSGGAPENA